VKLQKSKLSEEDILKALEGQENVLAPLAEKEREKLSHLVCVNCGSPSLSIGVNPKRPFSPGSPLPNKIASCKTCGAEFDPQSGLISKPPLNPA
jgi:hypothetical protein